STHLNRWPWPLRAITRGQTQKLRFFPGKRPHRANSLFGAQGGRGQKLPGFPMMDHRLPFLQVARCGPPLSLNRSLNVAVSQALISSTLPETSTWPSGLTNSVGLSPSSRAARCLAVATSHALTPPPSAPENSVLPSGEKAKDRIIFSLLLKLA